MTNDPYNANDDAGDDLAEYLQMYLDETEEQLDDLTETMLVLEQSPQDEASLNASFRLLHSMKGASGMMGFDQITVLTHHLETRFERLRSGRIELDQTTMNLTLRCIDFLRQCNDRLRSGDELATPDVLLRELHELEDRAEQELEIAKAQAAPLPVEPAEPISEASSTEAPDAPVVAATAPTDTFHVITFFAEAEVNRTTLARDVHATLASQGTIVATRPELNELDDNDGLETFDVILESAADPPSIATSLLLKGVESVEVRIPRDPESQPLATAMAASTTPMTHAPMASPAIPEQEPNREATTVTEAVSKSPLPAKASETMRVDIDRLDSLMNLAGELIVNRAQFLQVSDDIGPTLRKSASTNRSREFCDTLESVIEHLHQRDDRLNIDDVELPTMLKKLEAGLVDLRTQAAELEESRRCFVRLDEAIDQLSRVSDNLQRGVLGTRMVPVGPLFSRFKRTVRDLSKERNKDVHLVMEGETTELDKRMIDALGDPMVHLVRNSLDHGLENQTDRAAIGKPPTGTITLTAKHIGNHVYIIVHDDGGGIDADKIRARLIKRGILNQDQAIATSDRDIIEYIWHPGFSTAEAITDISGRGVGMDVVKSRIEELSGSIDIETAAGQGTSFTLKLPLTLAIISSLLVRIRGIVFSIPMDDVREIVSVEESAILRINKKHTFEVRREYIPLVDLNELMDWNESSPQPTEASMPKSTTDIVILQTGGKNMGLRVDSLLGSQDVVIKSLTENFIGVPGLAGASILGDGTVALMLDVSSIVRIATLGISFQRHSI